MENMPIIDYDEISKYLEEEKKEKTTEENETKIESNSIQQQINAELNKLNEDNFIPIGLTRLDGIINVNPVLEFLSGIQEFEKYFIERTLKFKNNNKTYSFVTSRLFYNIYKREEIQRKKVYDSSSYLIALQSSYSSINHENNTEINNIKINNILMMILYNINEETKKEKNSKENKDKFNHNNLDEVIKYGYNYYINKNNSIITEKLNYFLLQTIECPKCNNKYYEIKSFPTFELNITEAYKNKISPGGNKIISLQNCLDNETINSNKSILFYCTICNSYIFSNKVIYQFYKLGDKLIFLLERNSDKTGNNNKSNNIILNIDEKINMNIYSYSDNKNLFNCSNTNNLNYELIGIISYEIEKNKYVCFLKSYYIQKWYLYIDEYTEEKNLSQILNEHNNGKYAPYTLMYSRIKN